MTDPIPISPTRDVSRRPAVPVALMPEPEERWFEFAWGSDIDVHLHRRQVLSYDML